MKSVNVTVANGRNYNLGCTFPFTVSNKNIFVGTAYISNDASYVPASFELEGNNDLICIVGSPYNGKAISALYISVDAYL